MTARATKRRWFQFSLRTLLILVTVGCVAGGWWINRAFRQRAAVRRFYELANRPDIETLCYRFKGKLYSRPFIPGWLLWLRDVIGEECFGEVIGIHLHGTAATNDDLRHLTALPSVEWIWLAGTKVDDNGIEALKSCPKLKYLSLDDTDITDAGILHLSACPELEEVTLCGTKVSDASLPNLARLQRLQQLWLINTAITDIGVQKLRAALPRCRIQTDEPMYFDQRVWGTTWTSAQLRERIPLLRGVEP